IDKGLNIKEIDLGGMGAKEGRERLYHTISTNSEENESFLRIMDKGVHTFIQIMPQNEKVNLKDLIIGQKK
ncbi:PTS mannose transporter subunit IID, partial [Oenococcus oeni IOEB_9304]